MPMCNYTNFLRVITRQLTNLRGSDLFMGLDPVMDFVGLMLEA